MGCLLSCFLSKFIDDECTTRLNSQHGSFSGPPEVMDESGEPGPRATTVEGTRGSRLNSSVYEMYSPDAETGKIEMEIVFFHGLRVRNYHTAYIDTWMSRSEAPECWIETWLPQRFPRARVLTVTYDSSGSEGPTHGRFDLELIAESLAQDLISSAKVGQQFGTPVILVGHCIGGLVIQKLCLHAGLSHCKVNKDAREEFIENVMGAFLLATPQAGMNLKPVENPSPLAKALEVLGTEGVRLARQFDDLRRSYDWLLCGVGESQPTRSVEFSDLFDEKVQVVPEASARQNLDQFLVIEGADHLNISKPRNKESSVCHTLFQFLDRLLMKAKIKYRPACPQALPKVLVGLDKHVSKLEDLLKNDDIPVINIWGMGGIGKSTVAKSLLNKLSTSRSFDFTSFVESSSYNARDKFTLATVIRQHLYRNGRKVPAGTPVDLRKKKILFILDDLGGKDVMSENNPLDIWYNETDKSDVDPSRIDVQGSRLVVTSREQDVLKGLEPVYTYEMSLLGEKESYDLLVKHAFPGDKIHVPGELSQYHGADGRSENLVTSVARLCDGLPLALVVIGQYLFGKVSPDDWLDCRDRLHRAGLSEEVMDKRLWKKLYISYDGLDTNRKHMFLDAATIFNGFPLDLAQATWNTLFRSSSKTSWNSLINRSLVYGITDEGADKPTIRMHEQLRSLGRYIADSEEEKSRRRIWKSNEAWEVITERNWQLQNIRALRFHFSELSLDERMDLPKLIPSEETYAETPSVSPDGKVVRISSSVFRKMTELRYLILDGVDIAFEDSQGKSFSNNLIMLIWTSGATISELSPLPSGGDACQLTILQLQCIHLKSLVVLVNRRFPHLKFVEVRSASSLEEIPDRIEVMKNLERLSFFWCRKLKKAPRSLGNLERLEHLVFWDCPNLESLPELPKLCNLERLILFGCSRLKRLPSSVGKLAALKILDLHRLNLEELPLSIGEGYLRNLQTLLLSGKFQNLPDSFGMGLVSLKYLKLKYCENLESLPPYTLRDCSNIERLTVLRCYKLHTFPGADVFSSLKNLRRVIVGWTAVETGTDNFRNLWQIWGDNQVDANVRGTNGPGLASPDYRPGDDELDTISIDSEHWVQEEDSVFESLAAEPVPSSPSLSISTRRHIKGESLKGRYLALESVHESLQRIVVTVESHDQGYSSFPWAQGTELCAHSFFELVVRSPEGEELAEVVIFRNLHAVKEWQTHHCEVEDEELLALVKRGCVVEVWVRSLYLAWETYVKYGSLELVSPPTGPSAEMVRCDSTKEAELINPSGFDDQKTQITSYNCENFPRVAVRASRKEEFLRIECHTRRLEKIYVEFDSNIHIAEGSEGCYNGKWGPIWSDMGASSWSCNPYRVEIGVIGEDGEEVEKRIRLHTNMYSGGFGRQRHTYLVEDDCESSLKKIEKGCTLVLYIKLITDVPGHLCWWFHVSIRHAEIRLIPKADIPSALFPDGVSKVETTQKLQRGKCLNWMHLAYQNPFEALHEINVVVEAKESALKQPEVDTRWINAILRYLRNSTDLSLDLSIMAKIAKTKQLDLDKQLKKLRTPPEDENKDDHGSSGSESGHAYGATRNQVDGVEMWEGVDSLPSDVLAAFIDLTQSLGESISWGELNLLSVIDSQEGQQVVKRLKQANETGKGSTWGELGVLTPEGREVGERIVVFTNPPHHLSMSWNTHEIKISESSHKQFLTSVKKGHRVALWLRSGPGWRLEKFDDEGSCGESSQICGPASHCARYASMELVPNTS